MGWSGGGGVAVGGGGQVLSLAKSHNADVSRAVVIDPRVAADVPEMAAALVALRGGKGMTEPLATELLRTDPNWYVYPYIYSYIVI
jgi:phosphotransacetylase